MNEGAEGQRQNIQVAEQRRELKALEEMPRGPRTKDQGVVWYGGLVWWGWGGVGVAKGGSPVGVG